PRELAGAVNLGFTYFPLYRLFVIGVTIVVLVALFLFLEKTNVGLIIRAGSRDPLMVKALGFDLGRVWLLVFGIGTALAGLAGIPFLVPYKALATQVLIYGLFALGFNLLYGYTGLLSFGHAAYWGLGAYGTGIALAKLKVGSLWLALAAGLGLAAASGAAIGF